jgi:hypothetical protein
LVKKAAFKAHQQGFGRPIAGGTAQEEGFFQQRAGIAENGRQAPGFGDMLDRSF